VEAAQLASPPTIDGDLADWKSTAYAVNACVFGCAQRTGDSDLSGTYYLGYDGSNLYLAVQVRDDKFVQVSSGTNMYQGDDVEIQLDANLATDFSSTSLTSDDYQIGLSAGNFGSISPQAYRWYPHAAAGSLTTAVVKAKKTSDGYALEAKLPWAVFGLTPSAGNRFGLALSLSDNDLSGSATQQSLVSSVGTRKLLNPTTWGTLVLGPGGGS
jgi:hypothetical protein